MAKRFPFIEFVAHHGRRSALIAAGLSGLGALACFAQGGRAAVLVVGVIVSIVLYAGLRLGAELIEVIAETLLPR
jgi:membrane-associated PAP2 superfamily phosphatase